jgi:hypothetical protein
MSLLILEEITLGFRNESNHLMKRVIFKQMPYGKDEIQRMSKAKNQMTHYEQHLSRKINFLSAYKE